MIPLFLHWVWPQTTAPCEAEAALRSWREHHPAWRHLIWTPEPNTVPALLHDLDFEVRALPPLVNQRLYSSLSHCASEEDETRCQNGRALVAGLEIVARYGGVCPPLGDFCTATIESLLHNVRLFTRPSAPHAGAKHSRGGVGLPLYGATPNHPALWKLVRELELNAMIQTHEGTRALCAASLAEIVQLRLNRHPDGVTFPAAAFEGQVCSIF